MPQAPWGPRWNQNAEITKDGLIVMAGGIWNMVGGGLKDRNDVWLSPDGGWTWTQCNSPTTGRDHWTDREWLMTVIGQKGFIYVMGGNDWDTDTPSNDVWRSRVSLHDIAGLQDTCSLPPLRSGCASYGLLCLPPSLPGGESTSMSARANNTLVVSCNACPASSVSANGTNSGAVAAAIIFALLFAAVVMVLGIVYHRAKATGNLALFRWNARGSATDSLSQPLTTTDSTDHGGEKAEKSEYEKL